MLTQQQVGRFEIRDFLGRGAMGDVYLAWDPQRQAEVALKLVRTHKADPEMLEAEKSGATLQQQLARVAPQVAAVYEQGQDDPFLWVAMEYVAGTDLSEILDRGPLPEERAVRIALQLCSLLEAAHQFTAEIGGRHVLGIVHGDIKPENIRLQDGDGGDDRVRILDFGIAKHLSQTRKFTVNLFGSLPYTPPERLERGVVDYHSDLWALGIVLYMMVAGQQPYVGRDAEELEMRIRRGEPPMPLPQHVTPGLRRIVYRSLAFEVARRYPTAAAYRADLEAWLSGQPLLPGEHGEEDEARDDLSATRRTARSEPVPPEIDATRRTDHPPNHQDNVLDFRAIGATRRTGEADEMPAILPPLPPLPVPPTAAPDLGAAVEPPRRRRRRWPIVLLALLLLAFGGTQLYVRGEAREIQRELLNSNPDLDALLARYQEASDWDPLGIGLGGVGDELHDTFVRAADEIISSYHGDNPRSTEKGWQRARDYLRAALNIRSTNRKATLARVVYAQAQLDRIAAQTLRADGRNQEAREKSDAAVSGFRDAARRDSGWPDPYLGLARIYAYERFDLEELQKALGELGRRGYPLGRREKAMLADGFRMRGIELHERAKAARDVDDQLTWLDMASDKLRQALDLYNEIPSYANVQENRAATARRLSEIEIRRHALHEPGVLERLIEIIED
ncbi:MAG TPA: serine/threonine-protein kinase [Thermoanaerobaculia bacterium]|nr:serine/threonine-protein kinase [Thermoanaerobaculia bacterium]